MPVNAVLKTLRHFDLNASSFGVKRRSVLILQLGKPEKVMIYKVKCVS